MSNANPNTVFGFRLFLAMVMLACASRRAVAQDMEPADASTDGGALAAQTPAVLEEQPEPEQFVPESAGQLRPIAAGTLVLRASATVSDSVIRVKNVCRWSQADAALFGPVAELTVSPVNGGGYQTVTIDDIRTTLGAAGMNVALVSFNGATSCRVNRSGDQVDEQSALEDWIDSRQGQAVPASATDSPAAPPPPSAAPTDAQPLHSLRQILIADLCRSMQLEPADVEMSFNSADDKVLNLVEPYFQFEVTPRRVRILSDLCWEVTIVANGERHKMIISASARIWEVQAVAVKPLAYQQIIRDEDLVEKRVLSEQMPEEPLLTKAQAVGQSAARELKPGMTLTASMVDPALLARSGQLITINVIRGSMKITAVAKAMESGSYGQTIRARNDVDPTRIYEVELTGPQQGVVTDETSDNSAANPNALPFAAN